MNSNERKISALQAMALNFDKEIPPLLLKTWLKLLAQYSPEQVEAGVERIILSYKFKTLPPFAELKEAIERASGLVVDEKDLHMAAEAEWLKLRGEIRRVGYCGSPKGLHVTTMHVIKTFGGWSNICESWLSSEMQWRHKDFIERWIESYGKEELISLGADSVLKYLGYGIGKIEKSLPQKQRKAIGVTG